VLASDDDSLTRTLIHEKIHVYQRLFPVETAKYTAHLKCVPTTARNAYPLSRANPDLDKTAYACKDELWLYQYKSHEPTHFDDVQKSGRAEHPYEHMAYHVASLF
jgi:hypothetical protein